MKKLLLLLLLLIPAFAKAQFCNYTYHAPITLNNVTTPTTISGDSILSITLNNCQNIHITKCKIIGNVSGTGITVNNGSNLTIDSCMITNSGQGIILTNVSSYNVSHNYFFNVVGSPTLTWHPFQAINCTGYPQIYNYNKTEEIGVPYSHDQASWFQCHGASGHPIQCWYNTFRGGQTQMNGTGPGGRTGGNNGACGIGVDIATTWISVRKNDLINTGYAGIQIIGSGIDHVLIDSNRVFSSMTNISLIGLTFQATGATDVVITNNFLNWKTYNNTIQNIYFPNAPTVNTGNTANTTADSRATSTMIPDPQVTACTVPVSPPVISYTPNSNVYLTGTAITTKTPTNAGGTATSWSINKTMATGLSFNTSTGVISGTPTATKPADTYTITATNTGGSNNTTISMTVNAPLAAPAFTYSPSSNTYTTGVAITNKMPISTGGTIASYSINRALPTGLFFNTGSGLISGTPTVTSANTAYVITGTNATGSSTFTINLTVNAPVVLPPSISYSPSGYTFTYGTTIPDLLPTNTGGVIASYSISPSLPAGLSFNTATGLISGTPTSPHAATNYTVTATNSGGNSSFVVSISVQKATLVITAVSTSKLPGHVNPIFDVTYSGFQFSDSSASLSTLPTVTTNAVTLSPPGVYPLIPIGAASSNYSFSYVSGVLLIGTGPVVSGTFGGIIRISE